MSRTLVLGVDAGATTTRCVLATLDGVVVGRGTAGGANPNSSGGELAETIGAALEAALATAVGAGRATTVGAGGAAAGEATAGEAAVGGAAVGEAAVGEAAVGGAAVGEAAVGGAAVGGAAAGGAAVGGAAVGGAVVRLGVFGAAGSAGAGGEVFRAAAARAWARAGLTGEMVAVTDLEVAFAAGTADSDGVLLLSGTGALAARFAGGVLERRCDGYGWLLGDEGSAVWIGIRALRAVLAALDGRGEPTALVGEACALLTAGRPAGEMGALSRAERESLAQALLAAGFAGPPAALGRLAPAVSAAADAGDPVARRIAAAAVAKLLHTFDTVEPPTGGAVVLAGSVLLSPGPVARAVRAGVVERTGAEPREAVDGAGGAAALAIARLTGGPVPASVHARLTGDPVPAGVRARLTGGARAGRDHEPGPE